MRKTHQRRDYENCAESGRLEEPEEKSTPYSQKQAKGTGRRRGRRGDDLAMKKGRQVY